MALTALKALKMLSWSHEAIKKHSNRVLLTTYILSSPLRWTQDLALLKAWAAEKTPEFGVCVSNIKSPCLVWTARSGKPLNDIIVKSDM